MQEDSLNLTISMNKLNVWSKRQIFGLKDKDSYT